MQHQNPKLHQVLKIYTKHIFMVYSFILHPITADGKKTRNYNLVIVFVKLIIHSLTFLIQRRNKCTNIMQQSASKLIKFHLELVDHVTYVT